MKNHSKLSIVLIIVSVLIANGQSINKGKEFVLLDSKVNVLMAGDVCESIGLKERRIKFKRMSVQGWSKKKEVFRWPVKTTKKGKADIAILVQSPAENTVFVLSSGLETVKVKSKKGWQRINTSLELNKKEDLITLALEKDLPEGVKTASIISIEVITKKYLPTFQKQLQGFKDDLGDASWFQEAGYGIMFQWGFWGYPQHGERKAWKDVYRDFDIEAFADKMKKINAGYVIWSITWRGSRYAMPLQSV